MNPVDRRTFIGGSDIAAIVGCSPWTTPVQLWADKTNLENHTGQDKPVFRRGKRWESVVLEMLADQVAFDETISVNEYVIHKTKPHLRAELDAVVTRNAELLNVEIKTVHPFKAKSWGQSPEDIPVYYTAQVQWGLHISGREKCLLGALFGADELRVFEITRDAEVGAWLEEQADFFWAQVQTKKPPLPVKSVDLDILHPKSVTGGVLVADGELAEKSLELRAVKAQIKALELELEALEYAVKRALGDNEEIIVDGVLCASWKNRPWTRINQTLLQQQAPGVHKQFTEKGVSRVFLIK